MTGSTVPGFDPGFSTEAMTARWSPDALVANVLRVEAALATASAQAGLFEEAIAREIDAHCAFVTTHSAGRGVAILGEGWQVGTPVLVILDHLREGLSPEAIRWLHFGATTQDILDTAVAIACLASLGDLDDGLGQIEARLSSLEQGCGDQPMLARTFLQAAGVTSFAMRCRQWRDSVVSARHQLRAAQGSCAVQLGGPVGTGAALGPDAAGIEQAMAAALGLAAPGGSWHGDRSRVRTVVGAWLAASACVAKCASDLMMLSATGIGEVRMRAGGSSAIANKANPIDALRTMSAAAACAGVAQSVLSAGPAVLERGNDAWLVERFAVPLTAMTAGAAVEAAVLAVGSVEVIAEACEANLRAAGFGPERT